MLGCSRILSLELIECSLSYMMCDSLIASCLASDIVYLLISRKLKMKAIQLSLLLAFLVEKCHGGAKE